ncbi:MAG: two-component system histidine kinase PnpS [Candidatus Brocadiia bacterium]
MARKRLLWKLFPSYLVITLLSLVGVTWYATRSLRGFYRQETEDGLAARAHLVRDRLGQALQARKPGEVDQLCKDLGSRSRTRITVIRKNGEVVGDSHEDPEKMENHATPGRPEVLAALGGDQGVATRYSKTLEREMMYLALPLLQDGQVVGLVRTSIPVTSIEEALRRVYAELALAGLVIAAVAAVVSLLVSRRISQPLEEMERGAERFAQGELQARLPVPETEELASLAEAMNQMAAQLDQRLSTILQQRNEQEAILASMVEGVFAVDRQERLISINQAAARMLGLAPDQGEGRSIQEVVRNTALQQFVQRALGGEGVVEDEIVVLNGGERVLQAHGAALRDPQGTRIGAVVVLHDITRLRRLEEVRREFVANVSHELKTPLTSIKGFVETLLDGARHDPDAAARFLGIINKQVDRLNAIIEDLLLLSTLEQDEQKAAMSLEQAPVRPVLESALQVCAVKAAEKDVALEVDAPESLHARINPALLEQAVVNLADNAINYSPPGSTVTVEATETDDETVVAVRDQGCGIEPQHLPRLFERFYRADKARSRKLGGTGLGLAIVKHIAQAHRGRVDVESAPGEGSTFRLHLPRSA